MKNKVILSLFALMTFLSISVNVQSKEIKQKTTSDLKKSWTIKFNKDIDILSINNESVFIKNAQGKKLDVILKKDNSNNGIIVSPKNSYIPGEKYTIFVTKNVKEKNGMHLKEDNYMNFNVISISKEDISKDPNYVIDSQCFEDVNGDGKLEKIQVVLKKDKTDELYVSSEIRILIKNNLTNEVLEDISNEFYEHMNQPYIYDFNKDGSKDIMLPLSWGGNGGLMAYEIYSFKNNKLTTLYNEDFNNGIMPIDKYIKYEFNKDEEEVNIWSSFTSEKLKFNFSNYYMKPKSVNYQGELKLPYIEPVNIKRNGECDLKVTSRLSFGCCEIDNIVGIETIYKWDIKKGKWIIDDIKYSPWNESIIKAQ